jgi:hypothetical protein
MPGDIAIADQSTASTMTRVPSCRLRSYLLPSSRGHRALLSPPPHSPCLVRVLTVIRHPDYFNTAPGAALPASPYIIAQPVSSDPGLAAAFKKHLLKNVEPLGFKVHSGVNASGDTFYSAQGAWGPCDRDRECGAGCVLRQGACVRVGDFVYWRSLPAPPSSPLAPDASAPSAHRAFGCLDPLHPNRSHGHHVPRQQRWPHQGTCHPTATWAPARGTHLLAHLLAMCASISTPVHAMCLCIAGSAVQELQARFPRLSSMEMETFHLLDLARCSNGTIVASGAAIAVCCAPAFMSP